MKLPNKQAVDRVRSLYPIGCRVELVKMDDPQAPPIGTLGTVYGVDDIASVLVHWDNGSGLNVAYGEDIIRKVCPRCGRPYEAHPALSRSDNKTLLCPDCGLREALESAGLPEEEQSEILDATHRLGGG